MPNTHKELRQYFPGANKKPKVAAFRSLEVGQAPKKSPPVKKDYPYKELTQKEVYAKLESKEWTPPKWLKECCYLKFLNICLIRARTAYARPKNRRARGVARDAPRVAFQMSG